METSYPQPFKKPLVLIGFMAVGKTTIGRALAQEKLIDFVDTDMVIEHSQQCSINTIFSTKGELFFRQLEKDTIQTLLPSNKPIVISTGGGLPCYNDTMAYILKHATVVYLKASVSLITTRLQVGKSSRPLVKDLSIQQIRDMVKSRLLVREPYYSQANIVYNVSSDLHQDVQNLNAKIVDYETVY